MRQTNTMDVSASYPDVLARSSPVRRQLLGGMGDNSSPMPSPGAAKHWAALDDQIPLRLWAEERAKQGEAFDWGLGKGAPFNINGSSLALAHGMGKTPEEIEEMVVADFMPKDSPCDATTRPFSAFAQADSLPVRQGLCQRFQHRDAG